MKVLDVARPNYPDNGRTRLYDNGLSLTEYAPILNLERIRTDLDPGLI